jgi:hypothetical protein
VQLGGRRRVSEGLSDAVREIVAALPCSPDLDELISVAQAAALIGCSVAAMRKRFQRAHFFPVVRSGRSVLVRRHDVLALAVRQ